MDDLNHMRHALRLAAQGLGRTWPNPSVGCVLARDGVVIAAARTADGGRPHAEMQALSQCAPRGATAYVTLEPCAHTGTTPSCAEELIKAQVSRVVIACADPDPRTCGKGISRLREAGIDVATGTCEVEALALNEGFFKRITRGLPLLAIKTATSLDGFITDAEGRSQWITGGEARAHGHLLRAQHDAILTGINTVLADNPALNCRIPGLEPYSPLPVILDSALRFPPDAKLAREGTLILTTSEDQEKRRILEGKGIKVELLPGTHGHVDAEAALRHLAEQGVTRVLAEGGAALNTHLLPYTDRIYWFRAPVIMGSGKSAFAGTQPHAAPSDLTRFAHEDTIPLGNDRLDIYRL